MGLFTSFQFTEEDVKKINTFLPDDLQCDSYKLSDFTDEKIVSKVFNQIRYLKEEIALIKEKSAPLRNKIDSVRASKVQVFNTEVFDAVPLGFVDLGVVVRFGTASTGNRFENGVLGYAIEEASDKVWAKNNAQYNSVREAKLELLTKAIRTYEECNQFFKFEIDFREIGSSGNVFLYLRGTACKGQNNLINDFELADNNKEVLDLEMELADKQLKLGEYNTIYKTIPTTKNDLVKFLAE
jgi:hypothetical protein